MEWPLSLPRELVVHHILQHLGTQGLLLSCRAIYAAGRTAARRPSLGPYALRNVDGTDTLQEDYTCLTSVSKILLKLACPCHRNADQGGPIITVDKISKAARMSASTLQLDIERCRSSQPVSCLLLPISGIQLTSFSSLMRLELYIRTEAAILPLLQTVDREVYGLRELAIRSAMRHNTLKKLFNVEEPPVLGTGHLTRLESLELISLDGFRILIELTCLTLSRLRSLEIFRESKDLDLVEWAVWHATGLQHLHIAVRKIENFDRALDSVKKATKRALGPEIKFPTGDYSLLTSFSCHGYRLSSDVYRSSLQCVKRMDLQRLTRSECLKISQCQFTQLEDLSLSVEKYVVAWDPMPDNYRNLGSWSNYDTERRVTLDDWNFPSLTALSIHVVLHSGQLVFRNLRHLRHLRLPCSHPDDDLVTWLAWLRTCTGSLRSLELARTSHAFINLVLRIFSNIDSVVFLHSCTHKLPVADVFPLDTLVALQPQIKRLGVLPEQLSSCIWNLDYLEQLDLTAIGYPAWFVDRYRSSNAFMNGDGRRPYLLNYSPPVNEDQLCGVLVSFLTPLANREESGIARRFKHLILSLSAWRPTEEETVRLNATLSALRRSGIAISRDNTW